MALREYGGEGFHLAMPTPTSTGGQAAKGGDIFEDEFHHNSWPSDSINTFERPGSVQPPPAM